MNKKILISVIVVSIVFTLTNCQSSIKYSLVETTKKQESSFSTIPSFFDWRLNSSKPVVTPVYDQGSCASSSSISASENIESRWALAGHQLIGLSFAQISACMNSSLDSTPPEAFQYVISAGGLESMNSYPASSCSTCNFNSSLVVAKISSWEWATKNQDEMEMAEYLYKNGPLSVCVAASTWTTYQGGIFSANKCTRNLDHCVLLVGYDLNEKYWTVRNSWGSSWGENGYLRLEFGKNACGVADIPTSSVI